MIREALRAALLTILKNHTYEFNGEIRRQLKGGPIGLDLTGTVAKVYMKWWDGQLRGRLYDVGVECNLYERYTDDVDMVTSKVEMGARYIDGEMVITNETRQTDQGKPDDLRTFEFIKQVANSIKWPLIFD